MQKYLWQKEKAERSKREDSQDENNEFDESLKEKKKVWLQKYFPRALYPDQKDKVLLVLQKLKERKQKRKEALQAGDKM